jgi:hypothetical protein
MTNVSQDGVSEGESKSIITEELNLIRSPSPSFPPLPRVRAPNDLLCLLKTANPQMHVHDLISTHNPQSRLLSLPRTTKKSYSRFSGDGDQSGNCCSGTVIDSDVEPSRDGLLPLRPRRLARHEQASSLQRSL